MESDYTPLEGREPLPSEFKPLPKAHCFPECDPADRDAARCRCRKCGKEDRDAWQQRASACTECAF